MKIALITIYGAICMVLVFNAPAPMQADTPIVGKGVYYSTPTPKPQKPREKKPMKVEELIEWKLTAYCPCRECSGGYGRHTATGKIAKSGRTIAVDPKVIPYGSRVMIDGHEYIAEDCGGAVKGHHIDIFFDTHEEVRNFGKKYGHVYVKRRKK